MTTATLMNEIAALTLTGVDLEVAVWVVLTNHNQLTLANYRELLNELRYAART